MVLLLACAFDAGLVGRTPQQMAPAPRNDAAPATGVRRELIAESGTATISGIVTDTDGAPLSNAAVTVQTFSVDGPYRKTATDGAGQFVFPKLPSGRYRVSVTYAGRNANYDVRGEYGTPKIIDVKDGLSTHLDVVVPSLVSVTGRVTDARGEPLAGVSVSLERPSFSPGVMGVVSEGRPVRTDRTGEYRFDDVRPGRYFVSATTSLSSTPAYRATSQTPFTFPTYFPSTTNIAEAQVIDLYSVRAARAEIALAPAPILSISGVLVNSGGQASAGVAVTLRPAEGNISNVAFANSDQKGVFRFTGLVPGKYVVATSTAGLIGGDTSAGGEYGEQIISLEHDEADVRLRTQPLVRVTVSVAPSTAGAQPKFSTLRVQFRPVNSSGSVDWGTALEDASSLHRVAIPAPSRLFVTGLPKGWDVKDVLVNGEDMTGRTIDLDRPRREIRVEISLTNKTTALSGSVEDERGERLGGFPVVVLLESQHLVEIQ